MVSSKPSFSKMWEDGIAYAKEKEVVTKLGGNLGDLTNFCCVRTTHCLRYAGHVITQKCDFKDSKGNGYIIRVETMKKYLTSKFGPPSLVKRENILSSTGIICYDMSWPDSTGHFTLWNKGTAAFHDYFTVPDDDGRKATKAFFWNFS